MSTLVTCAVFVLCIALWGCLVCGFPVLVGAGLRLLAGRGVNADVLALGGASGILCILPALGVRLADDALPERALGFWETHPVIAVIFVALPALALLFWLYLLVRGGINVVDNRRSASP